MNQNLQNIVEIIQQSEKLDAEQKKNLIKAVKNADKELEITAFKLERTEKVKKTTAILLEETIAELEQKRKDVEKHNRELEIEASLEKVRSRTMAMQKSEDLNHAASDMFKQIQSLGMHPWACGFNIFDKDEKAVTQYMSLADGGISPPFRTPLTEDPFFINIYNARQCRDELLVWESKGESLAETYRYMFGLPGSREIFGDLENSGFEMPKFQITHCAYFSQGYLVFITYEHVPEAHDIFKRFAKVFEQTYTRFLDLQKAEAQARESEIQLALERVRARTMAMHQSTELNEVVALMYEQVKKLGVSDHGCSIIICDEKSKVMHYWYAEVNQSQSHRVYNVPVTNQHVVQKQWNSWRKGISQFSIELTGKEKEEYDDFLITETDHKYLPSKVKIGWQALPKVYFTYSNMKYGLLEFVDVKPINEDNFPIYQRFAKVFEQTYTRFLDLQKAEVQAHEAQIEAALERVRARSMAMHHTSEIQAVIYTVHEELLKLSLSIVGGSFVVINKDVDTELRAWGAGGTADTTSEVLIPNFGKPFVTNLIKGIQQGSGFFTEEFTHKEKIEYFTELFKHEPWSKLTNKQKKEVLESKGGYTRSCCVLNHTSILIINQTGRKFSEEENDILKRFTRVFEQTYIRFLDLQKAEAQARESEIQLALERVRARTMAMHKSEELSETVAILFQQFNELGSTPERMNICLINEEAGVFEVWSTEQGGKKINHSFNASLKEPTTIAKGYAGWKEGKKSMIVDLSGKQLDDWIRYLQQEMKMPFKEELRYKRRVHAMAFFSSGLLLISTPEPVPQETINLLERFADVFNLTYRRFLDLQKAEAQARESQIEASLERVRARTEAMHKSAELVETSDVLFQEIEKLGIKAIRTGVALIDGKKNTVEVWSRSEMKNQLENRILGVVPASAHPMYAEIIKAWKEKEPYYAYNLEGDNLVNYYKELSSYLSYPKRKKFNKRETIATYFFHEGSLNVISYEPLNIDQNNIMIRFAKVFGQLYRRFMDLQKAEAQAREAEIELGLERVRARAMAMQHSDELSDLVDTVFKELTKLDFALKWCIINIVDEPSLTNTVWAANPDIDKAPESYHMKFEDYPFHHAMMKGYQQRKTKYVYILEGEEKKTYDEYLFKDTEFRRVPAAAQEASKAMEKYVVTFTFSNFGGLQTVGDAPLSEASIDILSRFGKVFDLTYTRFNDLRLAEAQAREAQIEAALERVRSRTMGMQRSDELQDAAMLLFQQIEALSVPVFGCGFNIWDDDRKAATAWMAGKDRLQPPFKTSSSEDIFLRIYDTAQKGETLFVEEQAGKALKTHYEYMNTIPVFKEIADKMAKAGQAFPKFQIMHCAFFSHGYLMFISFEPVPSAYDIFKRFAKVFEQTYIRFLDLKKAEAQAREAQIEAALERVRSRTMAMHKSDELAETAKILFEQFDLLGKIPDRMAVGIINEKNKEIDFWLTDQSGNDLKNEFSYSIEEPTSIAKMYKAWKEGKDSLVIDLTGKSLKDWLQFTTKEARLPVNMANIKGRRVHHTAFFSRGFLVLTANEPVTDEMLQLLVRFTRVFDQTYRRFLDLQKAEAQAREALKQASLDRVRGEIASMRTSEDLNRITPVIWRELKALEVPFIRCGVFIVSDDQTHTQVYLTTPEGKSLGVLNLSTESNALTKNSVEHWKKKQIYKDHWNKQQFIKWTKSMMELGQVQNAETYQGSAKPPESLHLHFVPFAQGMLYVGNVEPLDEGKLELAKTLAEAFSIAYARYEDFKKLEEAKAAVEGTLKELKSAQAQLVHSEKMASLGELTAGIAHEIKNPLNFVNNFSEVSSELIDEAMEELQKGNNEDVLDIVKDLKQNLEKINHHGKRADSIVKGMLLHSRGTAGEKTPTDINDLLEQYVNLAYHGMRAQNKDFNITIERDYDESLDKINVVPQDISRVFLNIINNGCYSANDKKKTDGDGFSPTIKVSTKNLNDKVEIRIKDNGNGVPDKIKDKLFQPFFTTKPTGEGTGLGLSLSYDIVVKQHGGEIKIDSKEGEGAEFVITLPYS